MSVWCWSRASWSGCCDRRWRGAASGGGPRHGSGAVIVLGLAATAAAPIVYRLLAAVKKAGPRHLKLHGARHTAATQSALDGVAPAVIAAWLGHTDASFTMKRYTHSQPEALKSAGDTFDRVVTSRDTQQG
ncbi:MULTISPECIES: tyrosine-type recombinase/integrase [Mycobacterium]|uniref:tyrosine-type recombinase/integrase n=1 Tax=Mycobacterium TaxID=1763 RepID=UPI0020A2EB87|nr:MULTISPECIES: tyrosine-type recombinase/integrase [Mycobacterium]